MSPSDRYEVRGPDPDGDWKMLLVPTKYGIGYREGFDRDREYEFKRVGGEPKRLRLADQSPYFNVAGLLYRENAIDEVFSSAGDAAVKCAALNAKSAGQAEA